MQDDQSMRDNPGVAFKPPFLLLVFIVIGFIGRWLVPLSLLPQPWPWIVGPIVVIAALGLFFWTARTMSEAETGIDTDQAATTILNHGPFGISRNPIYLAMVTLLIGLGLLTNSLWFIGLAVLKVILLTWGVIIREERYLETKFGDEYLRYKSTARRWI